MSEHLQRSLTVAGSIEEALAARRQGAAILAGGTWLMRDPRRGHALPDALVSLHKIAGLTSIHIETDRVTIGAAVTHDALARSLSGIGGLEALAEAASGAANPAIRRVATVGGNLCTQEFAAADLLPPLLAVKAEVELYGDQGTMLVPMVSFLTDRKRLLADAIVVRVIINRDSAASAHVRLPLRRAGDYPVAIVSMARRRDGRVLVAVGSVEYVARRWLSLEQAFAAKPGGSPAEAETAYTLAIGCNDFQGRDGLEADGWYRRQVLPALVRRCMAALLKTEATR
ncbi:FAD binding domain-containing protein [Rhizobium tumorigenes]|uniref:FAD binding domain-containing protein n=1 Tax=Rhizobium tumorigenes TaxID=2041385 RepID=UPI00241EAE00|nr:FAD binding domain-containing protein [Rhizobium tumorigenes]WFS04763.1 FAD binding domain-containing protein [Rhizobium tumorigenes]